MMNSSWTTSELALADAACFGMRKNVCVLIGGLGLGYSLRRVLEICGRDANVVQAELIEDVVTWNRESLRQLNGNLLEDPRVEVFVGDVYACIKDAEPGQFDAILLDVDNGPTSLVEPSNMRLYTERGFEAIRRSLREGGKVAFWSADPEPKFKKQLRSAGFQVTELEVKAHERAKRAQHRIYVGENW